MNRKGQGALEYLLLIGGALIVVAVVLTVLPNLASGGKDAAATSGQQAVDVVSTGVVICTDYKVEVNCSADVKCMWDGDTSTCTDAAE